MTTKRQAILDQANTLLTEMRSMTDKAFVERVPNTLDSTLKSREIQKCLNFLDNMHKTTFSEIISVYRLLPEHIWTQYEAMQMYSLAEMRLLRDALEKFRRHWTKRPDQLRLPKIPKPRKPRGVVRYKVDEAGNKIPGSEF